MNPSASFHLLYCVLILDCKLTFIGKVPIDGFLVFVSNLGQQQTSYNTE